jgi:hypothetical protein
MHKSELVVVAAVELLDIMKLGAYSGLRKLFPDNIQRNSIKQSNTILAKLIGNI